jgi:hypothetical protein
MNQRSANLNDLCNILSKLQSTSSPVKLVVKKTSILDLMPRQKYSELTAAEWIG